MRIIFFSDIHIGLNRGYDMFDDIRHVFEHIISVTTSGIDLMVIGGDIFHYSTPKPRDYVLFIDFLRAVDIPVMVLGGNHDESNDGLSNALDPIYSMFSVGPGMEWLYDGMDGTGRIFVARNPGILSYCDKRFLALPYISNARSRRVFGADAQRLIDDTITDALTKQVDIAFSHLDITGARDGGFTFSKGARLEFTDVNMFTSPVLNGHIHMYQRLYDNVIISGSMIPTKITDTRKKRYIITEI